MPFRAIISVRQMHAFTGMNTRPGASDPASRARDHLANERTFLAWVRTGIAVVVVGFAIGRFGIAIREFMQVEGHPVRGAGLSVWFGVAAISAGVALVCAGLFRYRRTRAELETGSFEPGGHMIDVVAIVAALFGLALAGYLLNIQSVQ